MKLNKEQITLIVAAPLIGWLSYQAFMGNALPAPKSKAPTVQTAAPELSSLKESLFSLDDGSWNADGRNIFTAPSDEAALPPVVLPVPPRSPLPITAPMPIPGPDPYTRLPFTKPLTSAKGVTLAPRQEPGEAASEEPEEATAANGANAPAEGTAASQPAWKEKIGKTAQQRIEEERKKKEAQEEAAARREKLDQIQWMNGDIWYGEVVNDFETPAGAKSLDRFAIKLKIDAIRGDTAVGDEEKAKRLADRDLEIHFRQDSNGKLGRRQTLPTVNVRAIEFAKTPVNVYQIARRTTPKENYEVQFGLARNLLAAGEWEFAKRQLLLMLENGHMQRDVYTSLYDAAEGAFDHDAAMRAINDGLAKFPDDPELVGALADVYARFGVGNVAEQAFKKVLSGGTRLPKIAARYGRFAVARGFARRGDAAAAIDLLTRAADGRFDAVVEKLAVNIDLATAYIGSGNYQEARRILTDVLTADPTNADALNAMGSVELLTGHIMEAKVKFEAVPSSHRGYGRALYNLALAGLWGGDWQAARDGFYAAIDADPLLTAQAHIALAYLYRAVGQTTDALNEVDLAIEADPQSPEVLLAAAGQWLANGDWDRANGAYEKVIGDMPDQFDALIGLAECAFQLQKPLESLKFTDQALAQMPKLGPLVLRRAQILVKLGRMPEAKKALDEAKSVMPGEETDILMAYYYYNDGNYTEAKNRLQTMAQAAEAKGQGSAVGEYAKRWFKEVDDNLSKRVWLDLFNRTLAGGEIGYGWTTYARASGIRAGLAKNGVTFAGTQKQSEMPTTIYQELPSSEFVSFEAGLAMRATDENYAGIGLLRFQRKSGKEAAQSPYIGKETDAPASEGLLLAKTPEGRIAYRTIQNTTLSNWTVIGAEKWPDTAPGAEPAQVSLVIEVQDAKKNLFRLRLGERTLAGDIEVKGLVRAGQTFQLWVFTQAEIDKKIDLKVDDVRIIKRKG